MRELCVVFTLLFVAHVAQCSSLTSCENYLTARACFRRYQEDRTLCTTNPSFQRLCRCMCANLTAESTESQDDNIQEEVDTSLCADYPFTKMAYDCQFRISQDFGLCHDPAYRCLCRCTCAQVQERARLVQNVQEVLLDPVDYLPLPDTGAEDDENAIPSVCPDYEGEETGRTCLWRVSRLGHDKCSRRDRQACPCTCQAQKEDELCPDAPWNAISGECQLRASMGQCSERLIRTRCPCTCAFMQTCPSRPIANHPGPLNPPVQGGSQGSHCMDTAPREVCNNVVMNAMCSSAGEYCMLSCGRCANVPMVGAPEPVVNFMPEENFQNPRNPPQTPTVESESSEEIPVVTPPEEDCRDLATRGQCEEWVSELGELMCRIRWPFCRQTCGRCGEQFPEPSYPDVPSDQNSDEETEEIDEPDPAQSSAHRQRCHRCRGFELANECGDLDPMVLDYCIDRCNGTCSEHPGSCANTQQHCEAWAQDGHCGTNPSVAMACPRSCGLCPDQVPRAEEDMVRQQLQREQEEGEERDDLVYIPELVPAGQMTGEQDEVLEEIDLDSDIDVNDDVNNDDQDDNDDVDHDDDDDDDDLEDIEALDDVADTEDEDHDDDNDDNDDDDDDDDDDDLKDIETLDDVADTEDEDHDDDNDEIEAFDDVADTDDNDNDDDDDDDDLEEIEAFDDIAETPDDDDNDDENDEQGSDTEEGDDEVNESAEVNEEPEEQHTAEEDPIMFVETPETPEDSSEQQEEIEEDGQENPGQVDQDVMSLLQGKNHEDEQQVEEPEIVQEGNQLPVEMQGPPALVPLEPELDEPAQEEVEQETEEEPEQETEGDEPAQEEPEQEIEEEPEQETEEDEPAQEETEQETQQETEEDEPAQEEEEEEEEENQPEEEEEEEREENSPEAVRQIDEVIHETNDGPMMPEENSEETEGEEPGGQEEEQQEQTQDDDEAV